MNNEQPINKKGEELFIKTINSFLFKEIFMRDMKFSRCLQCLECSKTDGSTSLSHF